jgi:hypothetical protein
MQHFDRGGVSATTVGVYLVGYTYGALPGQTNAGGTDVFLRKYDTKGDEIWTNQFGSSDYDYGSAVSALETRVYVVGYTHGALPGQTSAGGYDAFVRSYESNGKEVWTRQFGSPADDFGIGVSATAFHVHVVGNTYGALPGQSNAGGIDAFASTFGFDGGATSTIQFGTPEDDGAIGVDATAGGAHLSGWTYGTLPGEVNAGSYDAFWVFFALP